MAGAAARRYARAAYELARESGEFETWQRRLEAVRNLLDQPRVRAVLSNPSLSHERRQEAVESLATEPMGREGLNLARLLVASNQVAAIDDIVVEFERLADEAAGRVRATAVAAVQLSAGEADRLRHVLADRLGREVRLQVRVEPGVLGGLVLRYGDHMVDASVASRLQQLRRALVEA